MCSAERELVGHGDVDTGILNPLLRSGKVHPALVSNPRPSPMANSVEKFSTFFHKWPFLEMSLIPPNVPFMMLKTIF